MFSINSIVSQQPKIALNSPLDKMPTDKLNNAMAKAKSARSNLGNGLLTAEKTQQILQQELANKLKARFDVEGIELKGLTPEDRTPEKVASNILNFVESAYSRIADSSKREKLMAQARKGIDQGFGEARNILKAIGVLSGKVEQDVNKTYDLIQVGLNKMENSQSQTDPQVLPMKEAHKASVANMSTSQLSTSQLSTSQQKETSVEIMTQEGDKVKITLSAGAQVSNSQGSYTDGNSSVSFSRQSSSSYASIQYSVDGNLNDKEKAAIDNLIQGLNTVAKDFYQGNVEQAFNKASQLGYNTDQLAQFSVSMNQSISQQSSIGQYQQIQQNNSSKDNQSADGVSEKLQNSQPALQQLSNFFKQLDQLSANPGFALMANPQQSFDSLMPKIMQFNQPDEKPEKQQQQNSIVSDMMRSLASLNG